MPKWVTGLGQTDVFRMLDWTFSGGGLIRGETADAASARAVG
jgi:hypothetical protein